MAGASLLLLSSCINFSGENRPEETRIGIILPISGERAFSGRKTLNGIRLAYEQIQKKGPVRGKMIKLVIIDNKTSIKGSQDAIRQCAAQKVSLAIAACTTANALAIKPLAEELKVPVLLTLSTGNIVTERNPYMFRCCFNYGFQARALAAFAAQDNRYSDVGVLFDLNDQVTYRRDLGREFAAEFKKLTGKTVKKVGYQSGTRDFVHQLRKFKADKVPAVFAPGDISDAGIIIKQARMLGIYKVFIGSDGWDHKALFSSCGSSPEPCILSSMFSVESALPEVHDFVRSVKARTGEMPSVDCAQAYDSLNLAVKALMLSQNPEDIRSGLYQIKNFPGVTGSITINAEGDAEKTVFIKKVVKQANGKFAFKLLKTISPKK
jgi:branched-chain amino acid transport system substrate-binding protein